MLQGITEPQVINFFIKKNSLLNLDSKLFDQKLLLHSKDKLNNNVSSFEMRMEKEIISSQL